VPRSLLGSKPQLFFVTSILQQLQQAQQLVDHFEYKQMADPGIIGSKLLCRDHIRNLDTIKASQVPSTSMK
jgi:hypothetical protein